ncbi:uncharacterized protein LOC133521039 [Cydia pomonella]|uniref:uncharacterized protein LOC133521039 n=1 Tax=Cydia pomonella TaxID=82600 RepID=UPI002ADD6802|nr:uncharacterized protein LOC133521039 [Cydia pomonella]
MAAAAISASISRLTVEAMNVLDHLNAKRLFPSDGPYRLPRDVRGLATLVGLTTQDAFSVQATLDKWQRLQQGSATVGQLFQYLEYIDRYDIRDDLWELALENCLVRIDYQVPQSQVPHREVPEDIAITNDDLDGVPQRYDAVVIYADAEHQFVDVMCNNMKRIGFKVCRKSNLVTNRMPLELMSELINTRCRYTIILFSKALCESGDERQNAFFAHAKQIHDKIHEMILCEYEPCQRPTQFRFYQPYRVVDPDFWRLLASNLNRQRTPRLEIPSWVNLLEPAKNLLPSTIRHGQVNEQPTYRAETSRVSNQNSQPNGQIVNNLYQIEAYSQVSNAHVQPTNVISNETPHTPVADQRPANAFNQTSSTDSSIVTNSQDGGAHCQPPNAPVVQVVTAGPNQPHQRPDQSSQTFNSHIFNGQTINDSCKQAKSPSATTFIKKIKKVILSKKWCRGKSL